MLGVHGQLPPPAGLGKLRFLGHAITDEQVTGTAGGGSGFTRGAVKRRSGSCLSPAYPHGKAAPHSHAEGSGGISAACPELGMAAHRCGSLWCRSFSMGFWMGKEHRRSPEHSLALEGRRMPQAAAGGPLRTLVGKVLQPHEPLGTQSLCLEQG